MDKDVVMVFVAIAVMDAFSVYLIRSGLLGLLQTNKPMVLRLLFIGVPNLEIPMKTETYSILKVITGSFLVVFFTVLIIRLLNRHGISDGVSLLIGLSFTLFASWVVWRKEINYLVKQKLKKR